MPVTFGTVEVIPQPGAARPAPAEAPRQSPPAPSLLPEDLALLACRLAERTARIRAH